MWLGGKLATRIFDVRGCVAWWVLSNRKIIYCSDSGPFTSQGWWLCLLPPLHPLHSSCYLCDWRIMPTIDRERLVSPVFLINWVMILFSPTLFNVLNVMWQHLNNHRTLGLAEWFKLVQLIAQNGLTITHWATHRLLLLLCSVVNQINPKLVRRGS